MASLGHLAVGVAAGRWRSTQGPGTPLVPAMVVYSVLALLPDVAFRLA